MLSLILGGQVHPWRSRPQAAGSEPPDTQEETRVPWVPTHPVPTLGQNLLHRHRHQLGILALARPASAHTSLGFHQPGVAYTPAIVGLPRLSYWAHFRP